MSAKTVDSELQLLREAKVGKLLSKSKGGLRAWRATGEGPPWIRLGRKSIRYKLTDLQHWISEQAKGRNGQ